MVNRPLIHVGYHKTGTTWLQKVIFGNPQTGFCTPWGSQSAEAIEYFVIVNPFQFSPTLTRQVFELGLSEAEQHGLVPVLSHEQLSGNPVKGRYWGKEVAERLVSVFPEARILLVIREQKSIILSAYRQYIKIGGRDTLEQFIGRGLRKPGFAPICRLDFFEYDLLISYYHQLLGQENVLALPFELLRHSPTIFCEKILQFAGANGMTNSNQDRENVGFQGMTLVMLRYLNRLIQPPYFGGEQPPTNWLVLNRLSMMLDQVIPAGIHAQVERQWQAFIYERTQGMYLESNRRTSNLIHLNLADYGYAC